LRIISDIANGTSDTSLSRECCAVRNKVIGDEHAIQPS
jgi:hypothetical protein